MKLAESICPSGEPAALDRTLLLALAVAAMKGSKRAERKIDEILDRLSM